jgi:hypothetical protein
MKGEVLQIVANLIQESFPWHDMFQVLSSYFSCSVKPIIHFCIADPTFYYTCVQVGMSIDPKLFVSKFPVIVGTLGLLIVGKTLLVTGVGRYFGLSTVAAARAGVLLAPGGEFAFVAFGDAVNQVRIFIHFYSSSAVEAVVQVKCG